MAPRPPDEPRPLSFAQTRSRSPSPRAGQRRLQRPTRVSPRRPSRYARLQAGLREVVRRHAILRTTFADVDGAPAPRVAADTDFAPRLVDLSTSAPATRAGELTRLVGDEAARPFDLTREWPLRVTLVTLGAGEHALLITLHHIASDAWSHGLLLDELRAVYEAGASGGPAPLPALALQYDDYAAWQRRWLSGDALAGHVAYWKAQLGEVPALRLPLDFPRPARRSYEGAARGFELSRDLSVRFSALCRDSRVTPFMALLAAFAALLSRHGGGPDIAIGSPIANRERPETERLIGPFVNTLVLRVDLSGDPTVSELLARVRRTALDAYAHGDLPFEKLVESWPPPGPEPQSALPGELTPSSRGPSPITSRLVTSVPSRSRPGA